jgi:hypothetical protein
MNIDVSLGDRIVSYHTENKYEAIEVKYYDIEFRVFIQNLGGNHVSRTSTYWCTVCNVE